MMHFPPPGKPAFTVKAPPLSYEETLKDLEKGLDRVDRKLFDLRASQKKDSPLAKTLENLEEEIQDILAEIKKQEEVEEDPEMALKRDEDLQAALRRLETELKETKTKQKNLLTENDQKTLDLVQVEVATLTQQFVTQEVATKAVKEAGALGALDTHAQVSKTVVLIQKMCEQVHVGETHGVTFTHLQMKNTAEVPSYFTNASVTITPDSTGKMAVHFSNLTLEQQAAAIAAIEAHPELLLSLLNRVPIHTFQIGERLVMLPETTSERESRQGRGGQENGQGGEQQKEQRER